MNIQEFRQKYPEYNDMQDQELADSFYSKYYTDMDRNDFDKQFLGSVQQVSQPKQQSGFFENAKKILQESGSKIYDITRDETTTRLPKEFDRIAGPAGTAYIQQALGPIFGALPTMEKTGRAVAQGLVAAPIEVGMEGVKSLFKLITPDRLQGALSEGMKTALQTPQVQKKLAGIGDIANAIKSLSGMLPESTRLNAEALLNLGIGGGGAIASKTAGQMAKPLAKATAEMAGKVAKEPFNILKDIKSSTLAVKDVVSESEKIASEFIPKSIKPTDATIKKVVATGTTYPAKVTPALMDHINLIKKGEVEITDIKGRPVKNIETVVQAKEVVDYATEKSWNNMLESMNRATGGGAVVHPDDMIKILEDLKVKNKKSIVPGGSTESYINETIDRFSQYKDIGMPLSQAQQDLTILNKRIFGGAKVEYANSGVKEVDQLVATKLRENMEKVIREFNGDNAFKEAKKLYGANSTMRDDLIRTINKQDRAPQYTLISESNIWMGYHGTASLLTGNVAGLIATTAALAEKKILRKLATPDNNIKTMYNKIGKIIDTAERASNPKSGTMTLLNQLSTITPESSGSLLKKGQAIRVKEPKSNKYWNENMSEQIRGLRPSGRAMEYSKQNFSEVPEVIRNNFTRVGNVIEHPNWVNVPNEQAIRNFPQLPSGNKFLQLPPPASVPSTYVKPNFKIASKSKQELYDRIKEMKKDIKTLRKAYKKEEL